MNISTEQTTLDQPVYMGTYLLSDYSDHNTVVRL